MTLVVPFSQNSSFIGSTRQYMSAKLGYQTKTRCMRVWGRRYSLKGYTNAPNKKEFCCKKEHILVRHLPLPACHGDCSHVSRSWAEFHSKKNLRTISEANKLLLLFFFFFLLFLPSFFFFRILWSNHMKSLITER